MQLSYYILRSSYGRKQPGAVARRLVQVGMLRIACTLEFEIMFDDHTYSIYHIRRPCKISAFAETFVTLMHSFIYGAPMHRQKIKPRRACHLYN